jgi:superfamily II DNA or RNA helicase
MFAKAFDVLQCDEMECMAFNVNLDLVVRLFNKFPSLLKVILWSNTEKITYSATNRTVVLNLIDKGKIKFYHVSENKTIVHGKVYNFKKRGDTQFTAIGSPNLSEGSNQNFEVLVYIYDKVASQQIWDKIPKIYENLEYVPNMNPPVELYQPQIPAVQFDIKLLEGLWAHQKAILSWLASNKRFSIVNIPPGTGKTEIAFAYLRYLFEINNSLTAIVLVPTTTLLQQWIDRLSTVKVQALEWGTSVIALGSYFANPNQKVLVTLYERFFEQYPAYLRNIRVMKPDLFLVLDECHNSYGHIEDLWNFRNTFELNKSKFIVMALSATIDSFKINEVNSFIDFMGGLQNQFTISLQSFYSHWNTLNATPVLKPINYTPVKYCLDGSEMEKLASFSKKIAIEMSRTNLKGSSESTAAIQRARWLRGLSGGVDALKDYLTLNIDSFAHKSTVIFVQTNEIASDIQRFLTAQHSWNPESSIYVYDSSQDNNYLSYAMSQFKKNLGFCLISEKMLSEGFDLPKIDTVILHGSDKSPRDWIQKVGRAIRYDPQEPESVAEIVDVVFCEPVGIPLSLEVERYEVLKSISVN